LPDFSVGGLPSSVFGRSLLYLPYAIPTLVFFCLLLTTGDDIVCWAFYEHVDVDDWTGRQMFTVKRFNALGTIEGVRLAYITYSGATTIFRQMFLHTKDDEKF